MSFAHRCARFATRRQIHASRICREQYFDATQETFTRVALNENIGDRVVLVDFYADWCSPCRMISPILKKLTGDPSSKTGSGRSVDLITIDTEKQTELARQYRDGKPASQFVGALDETGIKQFLQRL
ncbi:thioredoxin-like protein [Pisolithus marmoratus]|nr:thioredoxin-like protein [Pisolithus marmoratus]